MSQHYTTPNNAYIGNFKRAHLIIPLIQIIMFGMGNQLGLKDFVTVFKIPNHIIIGVAAQSLIKPLFGFELAKFSNFPTKKGAVTVLIGCSRSSISI